MKSFPIIYKYTTKGQVQQWQIKVDGDEFFTEEGIKGGTITVNRPTVCKGKNIGKKNETTPQEQAMAEAKAKHQKKLDKGYSEILTGEKKFFEPMLAKDYKDVTIDWGKQRVFVQPKLDGLRCINEEGKLMSRNGKPYTACPHLTQEDTILDGELYNHEYKDDFNKIVSLCKKQKATKEELEESASKVQFWAYDFPGVEGTFSERYKALKKWISNQSNKSIKLVPTYEISSEDELIEWHAKFLELGYEGTIVRIDSTNYENKRSKSLLKYKDFQDDEFTIIGFEEGKGGRVGTIGKFVVRITDDITCESNVKGNFEFLADVWKNRNSYIGTKATIKYFGYTPAGKLRFPYVIKLNRAEYE